MKCVRRCYSDLRQSPAARRSALALLLSATLGAPVHGQRTQPAPCDTTGFALAHGENGYRVLGDHCEGVIGRRVAAGATLSLVSLTEGAPGTTGQVREVHIAWSPPRLADSVWLFIESLNRPPLYRASAVRSGASSSFDWLLDGARAAGHSANDFGYLAWVSNPRLPLRRLYVPLSFGAVTADSLTARVVSLTALTDVRLGVGELGDDGLVRRWLFQDRVIPGSFFPKSQPFSVAIPKSSQGRLLKAVVTAGTGAGETVSLDFVFGSPSSP
jgi:hypothetical protein